MYRIAHLSLLRRELHRDWQLAIWVLVQQATKRHADSVLASVSPESRPDMAILESTWSSSPSTDTELRDRWRATVGLTCPTGLPDNSAGTGAPGSRSEASAVLASRRQDTVGQ